MLLWLWVIVPYLFDWVVYSLLLTSIICVALDFYRKYLIFEWSEDGSNFRWNISYNIKHNMKSNIRYDIWCNIKCNICNVSLAPVFYTTLYDIFWLKKYEYKGWSTNACGEKLFRFQYFIFSYLIKTFFTLNKWNCCQIWLTHSSFCVTITSKWNPRFSLNMKVCLTFNIWRHTINLTCIDFLEQTFFWLYC